MVDDLPKNGLLCSVCRRPQFIAPGGAVCENGHGGVEGVGYSPADIGSDEGLWPQIDGELPPPMPPHTEYVPPYAAYGSPPPAQPSREVMADLLVLVRKHWPDETPIVQKAMTVDMYWIALKKGEA